MRLVEQGVELLWVTPDPQRVIERAARTCYKSEGLIREGSDSLLIKKLIERGHEAMLEHASVSFLLTTDRGVTHEAVRHRLASFAQESTRFCNYCPGGVKRMRS